MLPKEQSMERPAVRPLEDNSPAKPADTPNGQEAPARNLAVPGAGYSNSGPSANSEAGNPTATQAIAAIPRPAPSVVPADATSARDRVAPRPQSAESDPTIARKLLKRVNPVYPKAARARKISGAVVLTARIGASGRVEAVRAVSGDPLLADAAIAAVREWVYEPLRNGDPQPSDETVIVNFSLH
jgi:protein TonB